MISSCSSQDNVDPELIPWKLPGDGTGTLVSNTVEPGTRADTRGTKAGTPGIRDGTHGTSAGRVHKISLSDEARVVRP